MLVLTRKRDQSIVIGDNIEILVVEVGPNEVRLGISAPKELSVHRKEVYEAIRQENIAATLSKPPPEKPLHGLKRRLGRASPNPAKRQSPHFKS